MSIRRRALASVVVLGVLAFFVAGGEAGRGRARRLRAEVAMLRAKVAQLESMARFRSRQRLHRESPRPAGALCADPCATDVDGDGRGDCEDPCPCDPGDADADADGSPDCVDPCPADATEACIDPCRMDSDGDGESDCADRCPYDPSASTDRDADGVPDCADPCPEDVRNQCVEPCPLDSDGDGIQDCTDPCPWGEGSDMPCVSPPKRDGECRPTGCSGQVCADHAVVTTCEWREEYACYRLSRCERQADGGCAWSPTPELAACLAGERR
jgi:eight-cysteine-cluster-containing protein